MFNGKRSRVPLIPFDLIREYHFISIILSKMNYVRRLLMIGSTLVLVKSGDAVLLFIHPHLLKKHRVPRLAE